jgi:monovalent cation/hydrogen antiporter
VLLVAGATMLVLVPKLRIPYPILLVLGGLALGFAPGLPEIDLPPDLVLVGVLPPLLYGAAFFTSLRDLRANLRPVGLLAVGLVLLTMVVVAVVAHAIVPGLSWAAAFVLGAVVSPTDPIAATAIMHRLGVPRRIVSIVEGESLVNDGTALVAYRVAVVAAVSGTFSLWEAGMSFVLNVLGGVAVGLAVGWIVRQVRRRLDFPPAEVTISLLTGYFAYIPAELIGVSAVIAAVTVGIYMGWYTPELTTPEVRLMGESAWEIVTFTLNALLFTLIGLQLPGILDDLDAYSATDLLWWAAAIWLTVLVARILWVYPAAKLPRLLIRRIRERDPMPTRAALTLIAWSGMRGAVSLAAALAIPLSTDAREPFPGRSLVLFLTFAVIFGTLVVQGLTLPAVIRFLHLEDDGEDAARELAQARIQAASAALIRLEELAEEDWVRPDTVERVRGGYDFRRTRFSAWLDGGDDGSIEARSQDFQRLRRELLNAERAAVHALRRSGEISDEVARRVERDLDLEDARLEI